MYLVPRSELGLQIGEVQDRHEVITPAVFQTCSKDSPNFVSVSRTFADALPHPLVRESDQADHSDREHPLASAKYRAGHWSSPSDTHAVMRERSAMSPELRG